jgi:hypothetical protein
VVDEPDLGHLDAVLAHDPGAGIHEALGVADLRAPLEGAVDEGGLEAGEVVIGHGSTLAPRNDRDNDRVVTVR